MNGVARKSSRHEPGLDSDWPPPSAPEAVCCKRYEGGTVMGQLQGGHCNSELYGVHGGTLMELL